MIPGLRLIGRSMRNITPAAINPSLQLVREKAGATSRVEALAVKPATGTASMEKRIDPLTGMFSPIEDPAPIVPSR